MSSWRIAVDLLVEAETPAEAQAMVERQMAHLAATAQAPEAGERKSRYWVGPATRAAAPPRQLKQRRNILDPQGPIRSRRSA
jgi:hypothetical protein